MRAGLDAFQNMSAERWQPWIIDTAKIVERLTADDPEARQRLVDAVAKQANELVRTQRPDLALRLIEATVHLDPSLNYEKADALLAIPHLDFDLRERNVNDAIAAMRKAVDVASMHFAVEGVVPDSLRDAALRMAEIQLDEGGDPGAARRTLQRHDAMGGSHDDVYLRLHDAVVDEEWDYVLEDLYNLMEDFDVLDPSPTVRAYQALFTDSESEADVVRRLADHAMTAASPDAPADPDEPLDQLEPDERRAAYELLAWTAADRLAELDAKDAYLYKGLARLVALRGNKASPDGGPVTLEQAREAFTLQQCIHWDEGWNARVADGLARAGDSTAGDYLRGATGSRDLAFRWLDLRQLVEQGHPIEAAKRADASHLDAGANNPVLAAWSAEMWQKVGNRRLAHQRAQEALALGYETLNVLPDDERSVALQRAISIQEISDEATDLRGHAAEAFLCTNNDSWIENFAQHIETENPGLAAEVLRRREQTVADARSIVERARRAAAHGELTESQVLALADAHLDLGERDVAEKILSRLDSGAAKLNLMRLYVDEQRHYEAAEAAEHLVHLAPVGEPVRDAILAEASACLWRAGGDAKALERLDQVRNTTNMNVYPEHLDMLDRSGRWEESDRLVRYAALRDDPDAIASLLEHTLQSERPGGLQRVASMFGNTRLQPSHAQRLLIWARLNRPDVVEPLASRISGETIKNTAIGAVDKVLTLDRCVTALRESRAPEGVHCVELEIWKLLERDPHVTKVAGAIVPLEERVSAHITYMKGLSAENPERLEYAQRAHEGETFLRRLSTPRQPATPAVRPEPPTQLFARRPAVLKATRRPPNTPRIDPGTPGHLA